MNKRIVFYFVQGVPDHLQNSDISGYIVEYIKDTSTFSQYVGNPETLTVNIR